MIDLILGITAIVLLVVYIVVYILLGKNNRGE